MGDFAWTSAGLIVLLLVCSGFFSGSETALTAASRARIQALSKQGDKRADIVADLRAHKERLIGGILMGNNLVNILASALATNIMIQFFGEAGVLYATAAMTLLVLVFAEVLPKTYALHNTEGMALVVARPIKFVTLLFSPFTHAVRLIVRLTFRMFGVEVSGNVSTDWLDEELRGAIDLHTHAEETDEIRHERAMLRSVLDLGDVTVNAVMTHRRNVATIDVDMPPGEIVDAVLSSPYTRIPLWKENADDIIGVLHAKALLRAVREADGDLDSLDVASLANPPWFIPESTTLLDQLQEFRGRREHFALVVDEYGDLMGIVTLEDILEEIVGEIDDEHDVAVTGVVQAEDGSLIVDGTVTIRELNREFEWSLPDDDAVTIAGLVLHEARDIPEIGQVFALHGYRFEITERHRNQITQLRVTRLKPDESDT